MPRSSSFVYEPKDMAEAGAPDWARGCDKCKYGLVDPPPATDVPAEYYVARAFQASQQRLTFCNCRAGNMMRQYLRKKWQDIASNKDQISGSMAQQIRDHIDKPTIRYVGTAPKERVAA